MLKEETLENKVNAIKNFCMKNEVQEDNILAFNIFLLLKGNHSFSEDFFASEQVIFKDTAEFIDIKDAVKQELTTFTNKLLSIYLSCFKHCTTHDENITKEIPDNYKKVLFLLDFQTIGKLFKRFNPIDEDILYKDAYDIVYSFSRQFMMYMDLINKDTFNYGDIS